MFTQQCRTTSKAICEFSKVTHKEQEIDIFMYGTGSQHFQKTSLIRIFFGFGKVYLFVFLEVALVVVHDERAFGFNARLSIVFRVQ